MTINTKSQTSQSEILANPQMGDVVNIGGKEYEYINHDVWRKKANTIVRAQNENGDFENLNADSFIGQAHLTGEEIQEGFITTDVLREVSKMKTKDQAKEIQKDTHKNTINALDGKIEMYTKKIAEDEKRQMEIKLDVMNHLDSDLENNKEELATLKKDESKLKGNIKKLQKSAEGQEQSLTKSLEKNWDEVLRLRKQIEGVKNGKGKDNFSQKQIDEKQRQIDALIEERKRKKQKLNPQKALLKKKQQELKKNQEKQSFQKVIIKQVQEKITKKQQEHTILQKKILEKSLNRLQINIKKIEIESQKIQAFLSMRTEGIGSPISEVETKGIEVTLATMQEAKTKLEQELPVYQEKINAIDTKIAGFDKTYFELVNVTPSENEQQGGMPIVYEGDKSNDIPVNPENPENSEVPEVPTNPETPEVPTNPETPEVPTNPEAPEVPTDPETPEAPEVSIDPENSENPEEALNPEDTGVPADPETPEVPIDPEVPTDPETPEVPADSEDTGVPVDSENSENTDTSNEIADENDEVIPFKPVPNPMAEYDIPESMTMKATLANMDEYIRDRAREQAEEQMRELYNKASLFAKPFFFFTRNGKTNKLQQQLENEILENMKAEMAASFAERVGRENALKNQDANNTIEGDNHIDNVVDGYVKNKISDDNFKEELQTHLEAHYAGHLENMESQVTDIFRQAKTLREYKTILSDLFDNPDSLSEAMQKLRSNPYFSEMLSQATGIDIHNNTEEIEKYLASRPTLAKLIHQKITVSIDIFDTAKGAYNISAEDKNTTGYKMGKWLQKHPYLSAVASSGTLAGLSAIGGGLLNVLGGGSLVGGVSGLRRNADMTDEHRGFETRIAHNKQQIQELRAQISDLENNLQNTTGWNNKRKLKKEIKQLQKALSGFERDEQVFGKNTYTVSSMQYTTDEFSNAFNDEARNALMTEYRNSITQKSIPSYNKEGLRIVNIIENDDGSKIIQMQHRKIIANATQRHFAPIERINNKLTIYFEKENLSEKDQEYYLGWLSQALARLDAGMQTGHNFLYSASGGEGEEDLDTLYRSVDSGIKKLGIDLGQIRNNPKYLRTVNQFIDDYEHAHNGFMNKRAKSARNTGIVSGALYGVSSTLVQAITGSGFFESKTGNVAPKYSGNAGSGVPTLNTAGSTTSTITNTVSQIPSAPVSTPTYAIDTGIADKLQQTLRQTNYDTFVNELTQHATPEEFWSILNDKIFTSETVTNQAKNEIMTYILNATDVVNGKEIPELITEAMNNNVLDSASFQTTLDRLAQWGYKNVDPNWLQESIQGLFDGSKVIADFSSEQQTIISEACFDAVHREGITGDTSPLYRVFMDTITETVPTIDTPVVPEGDIVPVSESVQKTTANWWGSLGIPTWRNTFLAWVKMKPSQRGETPTENNPSEDNPPQNPESSNETEGDLKNNADTLQELLKNDKEYLVGLVGALTISEEMKDELNTQIEGVYTELKRNNISNKTHQELNKEFQQKRKDFILFMSEIYKESLKEDQSISKEEQREKVNEWIKEVEKNKEQNLDVDEDLRDRFEDIFKQAGGLTNKIPGKEKLQDAVESGRNALDSAKQKVRGVGSAVKSKVGMTKDEALGALGDIKRQSLSALKSDANLDADVSVNTIIANALESNSIKEIKNAFSRLSEEQKKTEEAQKVQNILDDTRAGDKMKLDFLRDYNQKFSEKIAKARGSRENIQEEIISAPLQNTDNAPQKGNSIIDAMQGGNETREDNFFEELFAFEEKLPKYTLFEYKGKTYRVKGGARTDDSGSKLPVIEILSLREQNINVADLLQAEKEGNFSLLGDEDSENVSMSDKEFESWKQSLPHFLRNADDENMQLLFEVTQKEGEKVKEIMNKFAQLEVSEGSEKEVIDELWNIGQDLASIFGSIPKEDKVAMMKTLADAWNDAQNTSNRENPLYIEVPKIDDLVSEIQEFVIGDGIAKVNNISSWAVWKHGDSGKEVLQFAHVS